MKPIECAWCKGKDFKLENNKEIFNPDTDLYDKYENVYTCKSCGAYHVNYNKIKFTQKEINNSKMLQYNDCNIVSMN